MGQPCGVLCAGAMLAWQRGVWLQQEQREKQQRAFLKWRNMHLSGAFAAWRAYAQVVVLGVRGCCNVAQRGSHHLKAMHPLR